MRLGRELARRGHEVAVFTRAPADPHPEAPELRVESASGRSTLSIAGQLSGMIARFSPSHLVMQYTPQMLGASRFGSPALPWLSMQSHRRRVRTILLAHELFFAWRARADVALAGLLLRAQLLALLRSVDRALVTMQMRVEEIAPYAKLAGCREPIGVVRVGSNALPVPHRPQVGRLRMGVFSTLASTKRFEVVLDCFAAVHRRFPHAELVLLGDLKDPNNPQTRNLQRGVSMHPARDRIRVPGRQSLSEISEEVADLDIYLFPMISGANTRSSTLPLAFGAGVPVVAIRSYETDDVFVDGDNVVFSGSLSGDGFASSVFRLIDDPGLAHRVADGGKRLYGQHLAWECVADQFLAQA